MTTFDTELVRDFVSNAQSLVDDLQEELNASETDLIIKADEGLSNEHAILFYLREVASNLDTIGTFVNDIELERMEEASHISPEEIALELQGYQEWLKNPESYEKRQKEVLGTHLKGNTVSENKIRFDHGRVMEYMEELERISTAFVDETCAAVDCDPDPLSYETTIDFLTAQTAYETYQYVQSLGKLYVILNPEAKQDSKE